MKSRLFYIAAIILFVIILGILLAWPRINGARLKNESGLACLNSSLPVVQHYHPHVLIYIDSNPVVIPISIGLTGGCHLPLHTHEADNIIHVESQTVRDYTLGEFFKVWGEPLQKENYRLEMTVNGVSSQELENLVLKDKQEIVLKYTSQQ